jgi:hypothetical protein
LIPFRIFRGPLFHNPVSDQELFFVVSYRKPAQAYISINYVTALSNGRSIGIKPITKSISPFCVELLVSTFMATKSSAIGLTLLAVLLTDFCYCEVTSCSYIFSSSTSYLYIQMTNSYCNSLSPLRGIEHGRVLS